VSEMEGQVAMELKGTTGRIPNDYQPGDASEGYDADGALLNPIADDLRRADVIAAEIRAIASQTRGVVIAAALEIGRRLIEARGLVPRGRWGEWLQANVDYSERKAQDLMRFYEEYGDGRLPDIVARLDFSKALQLLALPAGEEREGMAARAAEENLSVRALKAEIEALRAEKAAMQGKMEIEQEARADRAEGADEGLLLQLEEARAEAEEARRRMEAAQEEAREAAEGARLKMAEAQEEAEAARREREAAERSMQAIRDTAASANDRATDSEKRAEAAEAKLKALKMELSSAKDELKAAEAALETTEAAAKAELERARAEAAAARAEVAQAKAAAPAQADPGATIKERFRWGYERLNMERKNIMALMDEAKQAQPEAAEVYRKALLKFCEMMTGGLTAE